ncbi:MAG: SDR family NAD(P)-dependent oxidoreductase [Bacteroidales bacterium]|nr:SDR family NAD(P)-dependent oxidoreductase [Bacteroidales bacterium]
MKKRKWTTEDIPDLTGKVIIVTGGNSGLGFESVKAFAKMGAKVILASRSLEKGEAAKQKIRKGNPKAKIKVFTLDLGDLESIKKFASSFLNSHTRLDVLLNNAGIMMTPYFKTKDGFEGQVGINHLGHFALTGLLSGILLKTKGSRLINVSSGAHKRGNMDFENLLFENGKDYSPIKAYGRSKLANLLFTYELQRRLEISGAETIAVAAHPGVAQTNLGSYMLKNFLIRIMMPIFYLISQDQAMGALPQIRASVDPEVKGGDYYGPDGRNEMKGNPVKVQSNKASHNKEDARRLWEESEKLTGVSFPFKETN